MLFLSPCIQGICQDFLWCVSKMACLWSQLDRNKKLVVRAPSDSFRTKPADILSARPLSWAERKTIRPWCVCEADSADQGWTGTQCHVWMMSWWCQCQAGSRYTPQNVYNSSFLYVSATVLFQWIFCFHQQLFKVVVSPRSSDKSSASSRNYLPVQVIYSVLFYLFLTFTWVLCVTFPPSALLSPLCLINLVCWVFLCVTYHDDVAPLVALQSQQVVQLHKKHMGGDVAPALVSAALPLTFLPLCLEGYWWAIFRCRLYNTEHRAL